MPVTPRVLIADGEAEVRERVVRVARAEGCAAVVTQDGNEALELVAEAKPALIFLGLRLTGLDGLAVLKRLRSDPETATVPVIMIPEKGRNLEANRWQWKGSDGYLARPPSESAIADKLRWFLRVGEPGRRILVVDDEAHVRRFVKGVLRDRGYLVDTAEDGEEALERLARGRPDLILLDVMMPRMDGFEVLRKLRADAATVELPVIMLTAPAADADILRSWRRGPDSYLTKPFSPAELLQFVSEMLEAASTG